MCPGRIGRATYTNNDGVRALITFSPNLGLKVFMDARRLVTPKEGDRYPLGPPSYGEAGATASVIHQFL
jgi:hypothetical protein